MHASCEKSKDGVSGFGFRDRCRHQSIISAFYLSIHLHCKPTISDIIIYPCITRFCLTQPQQKTINMFPTSNSMTLMFCLTVPRLMLSLVSGR